MVWRPGCGAPINDSTELDGDRPRVYRALERLTAWKMWPTRAIT
jgi:hypothetical protein